LIGISSSGHLSFFAFKVAGVAVTYRKGGTSFDDPGRGFSTLASEQAKLMPSKVSSFGREGLSYLKAVSKEVAAHESATFESPIPIVQAPSQAGGRLDSKLSNVLCR
jgi:hypothetical protein